MAKAQVTDAQIKAQILARNQQQQTTVESQFPTEIVPLPSKGLVYPKDHPLAVGQIELRYMTAKDEDILTNQNYLKQGIALDKLYKSLIVGNGKGQAVNIEDMIMGDRSAVMLAARVLGYGSDYEITITHPETGKPIKHIVDLNQLKPRSIDESLYNNSREFQYTLPISKKEVTIILQTAVEQKNIAREVAKQEKNGVPPKNTTTMLKHVITSVDGETDKKAIAKFIDTQLLARESLLLRSHIIDITPDYDLAIQVTIPEENYDELVALPIDVDFFWPRS